MQSDKNFPVDKTPNYLRSFKKSENVTSIEGHIKPQVHDGAYKIPGVFLGSSVGSRIIKKLVVGGWFGGYIQ